MNHTNFKSKFGLGDLIEAKSKKTDGPNIFGHVQTIAFRKSDAVNYTADYTIETVNGGETIASINEHDVVRMFSEKYTDRGPRESAREA